MNPEITKFLCPNCKKQYEIPSRIIGTVAHMICSNCGYPYNVELQRSLRFRAFCSKIAKKSTRSKKYYTQPERRTKGYLDRRGLIEGIHYSHNVRVFNPDKKCYYWVDFIIYSNPIKIIEVDPSIWHKYFPRSKGRKEFFRKMGCEYYSIKDKVYSNRKLMGMVIDAILRKNI